MAQRATSEGEASRASTPGDPTRGEVVLGRFAPERLLRRNRLVATHFARQVDGTTTEPCLVWSVYPGMVARSERASRAFVETMTSLSALRHPAIAEVLAVDAESGQPTVVARRPAGRSLREQIDAGVLLAPPEVVRIVTVLASALDALHAAEPPVLHRALSPDTVMIEPDPFTVWIEEAGYLHALVSAGFITDRAAAELVRPGYLVPEELVAPAGPAVDVFALSVLAFEALTGKPPFGTARAHELAAVLRGSTLPAAHTLRTALPEAVDNVFARAWNVARHQHYTSASAFAHDLHRALDPDAFERLSLLGVDPVALAALASPRATDLIDFESPVAAPASSPPRAPAASTPPAPEPLTAAPEPSPEPSPEPAPEPSPEALPAVELVSEAPDAERLSMVDILPADDLIHFAPPPAEIVRDSEPEAPPPPPGPAATEAPLAQAATPSEPAVKGPQSASALPRPSLRETLRAPGSRPHGSPLVPSRLPDRPRSTPPPMPRSVHPAVSPERPAGAGEFVASKRHTLQGVPHVANDVMPGAVVPRAPKLPSDLSSLGGDHTPVVTYDALSQSALAADREASEEVRRGSDKPSPPDPTPAASAEAPRDALQELSQSLLEEGSAVTQMASLGVDPNDITQVTAEPSEHGLRIEARRPDTLPPRQDPSLPVVSGARRSSEQPAERGPSLRPGARERSNSGELALRVPTPLATPSQRPQNPTPVPATRRSVAPVETAEAPPRSSLVGDPAQHLRAAQLLAGATVVSAVIATVGLIIAARSVDAVLLEAAARPTQTVVLPPAVEAPQTPPPAPPPAEAPPPAPIAAAPPAEVTPPPAPIAAAPPAEVTPPPVQTPPVVAVAPPTTPAAARPAPSSAEPPAAEKQRIFQSMRRGVADCVEGLETRMVTVGVHVNAGAVRISTVRLRGVLNEPPVSTCLEDVAHSVRLLAPAPAAWDFALYFPIGPARYAQ
ncbi:MAG: protein kinase [Myxococcales bacterium]|nr:protein kinase [Myxococcales bacterium]